jgi:predicted transcriptional regulator
MRITTIKEWEYISVLVVNNELERLDITKKKVAELMELPQATLSNRLSGTKLSETFLIKLSSIVFRRSPLYLHEKILKEFLKRNPDNEFRINPE